MGAADVPGAPGWVGTDSRKGIQSTLPEEENEERAETRVASEGAGALVESVKRSG